jgi:UDP-glucose 4-epimerase
MSVLVTGGAGYIGSHMVLALCDAGHEVVVLDNLSTGVAWAVHPNATLVEGDIADQPLVASIISDHKVSAIIHFAGSIVVPDSVTDPLGYYNNNTCKSRSLIESAVKGGVPHFIFPRRPPSTATRKMCRCEKAMICCRSRPMARRS